MNAKMAIALPLLALLCFATVGQTLGQTRVPGVHAEDYFTYTIVAYWSSDNASATVPADLLAINSTLWYKVIVSQISGSNVSTEDTWHFANGTDSPVVVVQNVDSGESYFMKGLIDIIGGNLGANDPLYPSGNDPRRINQTVSIDYGSGKRDANAVVFSYSIPDSSGFGNEAYYFDKATGMLVARCDNSVESGGNVSIIMLLMGTNRWTVAAPPSIVTSASSSPALNPPTLDSVQVLAITIAIVVVVIVVAIALLVFYRRKKSRKKFRHR